MQLYGWVIYNGFLPSNKFLDFAQMIAKSANKYGHQMEIYTNAEIISLLHHKNELLNQQQLPKYVVFTDKDIYLAKHLELMGIRVFNSAKAIEISDDKIKTYQALVREKLPIPKTIVAPKTFGLPYDLSSDYISEIVAEFGYPFIIKEAFGSFGEQVYLINNEDELRLKLTELSGRPFVFQEFIQTSYGIDLRLQVVGDDVVAAIKRTSTNDFRANLTTGGRMEAYIINDLERDLAVKASKAIAADFAGVDLLFGANGDYTICEVNSNAHIRNLLDCTQINAADFIIKYIEKLLGGQRQ